MLKIVKNIPDLYFMKGKTAIKIKKDKFPKLYGVLLKKKDKIQEHYNEWIKDKETISFPQLVFNDDQFDKLISETKVSRRCIEVYIDGTQTKLVNIMGVGFYNEMKADQYGLIEKVETEEIK